MKGLRVAARTSAFAYKNKSEDIQRIGEQLRVRTILEGSVRRAGNQVRITAQLVNVSDGYHIWSATYERQATDLLALQTEVARRVIDALKNEIRAGDLWGGMGNLRAQLTGE
jgi:TolB-like protein